MNPSGSRTFMNSYTVRLITDRSSVIIILCVACNMASMLGKSNVISFQLCIDKRVTIEDQARQKKKSIHEMYEYVYWYVFMASKELQITNTLNP